MIFYLFLIVILTVFHLVNGATGELTDTDIQGLDENGKTAKSVHKLLQKKNDFLQTFYLVSVLIVTILGIVLSFLWAIKWTTLLERSLSFLVLVLITMLFGIFIPEKIGKHFPLPIVVGCIHIISFFMILLKPLTFLIGGISGGILWLCGVRNQKNQSEVTEEEILSMVNEGHELGVIESSEAEMISNIFEYGNKEAKDIMINRSNMVAIDGKMHLGEAIELMLNEQYSRYPVYEDNLDHIVGVLYLKDALRFRAKDSSLDKAVQNIKGLLREPVCIPETKNIDDIFKIMQSEKLQMVMVIDEYGQTSGLIAMEDILEEIVGNIMDEYDEAPEHIEKNESDEYVIDGFTPLEELEDKLGISFDCAFETLNGFIISKLEHIPEDGESFSFSFGGYDFSILEAQDRRIKSVLVKESPKQVEEAINEESSIEEDDKK